MQKYNQDEAEGEDETAGKQFGFTEKYIYSFENSPEIPIATDIYKYCTNIYK